MCTWIPRNFSPSILDDDSYVAIFLDASNLSNDITSNDETDPEAKESFSKIRFKNAPQIPKNAGIIRIKHWLVVRRRSEGLLKSGGVIKGKRIKTHFIVMWEYPCNVLSINVDTHSRYVHNPWRFNKIFSDLWATNFLNLLLEFDDENFRLSVQLQKCHTD